MPKAALADTPAIPMKLPVITTRAHKGKALELDPQRETMSLWGADGEPMGTVSWESVINYIRALGEKPRPAESRSQPRAGLAFSVRYYAPDGRRIEGRASGLGGGGLFIDSLTPLPVGTDLTIEFSLPDGGQDWVKARGSVAWVCPKPDQYSFHPGMGIRFIELSESVRDRILDLVRVLNQVPSGQAR